jgi:hypothetical protein
MNAKINIMYKLFGAWLVLQAKLKIRELYMF